MRTARLLASFSAAFLLSSTAFAAATITAVGGKEGAKVGKEGAWKPATAGATIGENEFLVVPAESTVTVKLADGTAADFTGKALVPGRRLASAKEAGALIKLSTSLQKAAGAVVGVDTVGTVPGAGKACSDEEIRMGTCKKGPKRPDPFMSELDEPKERKSDGEWAEEFLKKQNALQARQHAEAAIKNTAASTFEKRRASLVLAVLAADDAELSKAEKYLVPVLAPPDASERSSDKETAAKAYQTSGYVLRGQIRMQAGDNKAAKSDFEAAAKIEHGVKVTPLATYRANYFLALLALGEGDKEAAEGFLMKIPRPKDGDEGENFTSLQALYDSAQELRNAQM